MEGGGGSSGGGGDVFASSTAPLTWHDFLERMRHPSAAEFVKSIKSFIVSFSNKVPDAEKDSAAIQEFLASMEAAFRAHSLWAGCSEEELESAGEGLEKYVMTKLFNRAFASIPEDVKRDDELYEKMALVQQFIRPENLDIKPTFRNETSWLLAQKELQKINMYKAPRDKLVCILNCCKVINNLLINASIASSDNPPGADEFLPVLIYVTIKANPPQLHSNLMYIQRYRRQSRLVSESAYFFTHILSAESFVWNIDANSLSLDEDEYQRCLDSARAVLSGLTSDLVNDTALNTTEMTTNKEAEQNKPTVSDLEKKGAADLLKEGNITKYFQEYPFLYARAGDLTVPDVESLLNCYKQLVVKYVSLSKAMHITNPGVTLLLTQGEDLVRKEEGERSSLVEDNMDKVSEVASSSGDPFVDQREGKD
ncbi:vacuolar protein sorting-associated protein 9A-like [Wolffia australiana]